MEREVRVKFNTVTPLWTGDAWQDNREIRPSSLIGSLRFWFAFYWEVMKDGKTERLNNGVPNDNLKKLEKPKEGKTFEKLLYKNIIETNNLNEAFDKTLEELGVPVPSRIFGCTGWKSRIGIEIKSFEEEELYFNSLNFDFPISRIIYKGRQLNTRFWIRKILFKDREDIPIKLFKNIEIKILTTEYWWDKYLKDFFDFFKDKLILVGGKNSFGFGFVNLQYEDDGYNGKFQSINNKLKIDKITLNYQEDRKVLGFNFKYYLRKMENRRYRKLNFGEKGKSSKIYVSNLSNDSNKYIYLLMLNNPFSNEREIPYSVFDGYRGWLLSLEGENNG